MPARVQLKSLAPLLIASGVSVGVPAVICLCTPARYRVKSTAVGRAIGVTAIALGSGLVTASVKRVYLDQHTPLGDRAPEFLVEDGVYGALRNPMALGMVSALVGESLFLNRPLVMGWAAIVASVSAVAAETVERSQLQEAFGLEYTNYRANTSAWIPRIRATRRSGGLHGTH